MNCEFQAVKKYLETSHRNRKKSHMKSCVLPLDLDTSPPPSRTSSFASTAAPAARSCPTTSARPSSAARRSGVLPHCSPRKCSVRKAPNLASAQVRACSSAPATPVDPTVWCSRVSVHGMTLSAKSRCWKMLLYSFRFSSPLSK